MLHSLLLAYILVVSAVIAEDKVEVPDEIQPEESGRLINTGEVNEDAYYGMKLENQANTHTNCRYHAHKHNHEDHNSAYGGKNNMEMEREHRVRLHEDEDFHGPAVLRSINSRDMHVNHPDIGGQNKIIAHVFSPDYHQPTWVLDYRYLKTGGRDYTRGPGGQILILPKNVHTHEYKEFPNYDSLLEHLRLKAMAEKMKIQHH